MNILMVVPYFVPAYAYGGPVAVVHKISKELLRRGHTVTVLTTDALNGSQRYDGEKISYVDGIRVIHFKLVSNKLAYYANYYRCFGLSRFLKKHIKEYDLVHLHDYFTYQNKVTVKQCSNNNIPYVITTHGVLNPTRMKIKKSIKKLFILFNKKILRNCQYALALTKDEEKVLGTYLSRKNIKIIPNGIYLNEYEQLERLKGTFKRKFNIKNKKIILYVGRIHKIKGLDILIRSFDELIQKEKECILMIVGPDEGYKSELIKLINELNLKGNVIFTGILNGNELNAAYIDSDIFAFTSYSEGLPMTILEACAFGLPCLLSKYCNVPEVAEFNAGFVVDNSKKVITDKLKRMLTDESLKEQMSLNAKRMIKERFTWEHVVDRLEEVYNEASVK
jgi:glycosyltransferase involved in cell wall biosynthesis